MRKPRQQLSPWQVGLKDYCNVSAYRPYGFEWRIGGSSTEKQKDRLHWNGNRRHFHDVFVAGCPGSCHFENGQVSWCYLVVTGGTAGPAVPSVTTHCYLNHDNFWCREWWICVISVATLWLNPAVCWQNAWLDSENSQFSQPPTSLQETHLVNWIKLICCLYRIYIGAYVTATHNTFYLHYRWLKLPVSAALSTCELVECCLQTVHRSQSSVTHLLSVHINNQSPAGIVHSCTSAQSAINWPRFQQCVHSDDGTNRYNTSKPPS